MKNISLRTSPDYKIWFISDLHLGHAKDFILNPRKYTSVKEAYEHTFQMLQDNIGINDIVINLGDAVVGAQERTVEYAKRMVHIPCQKHYYIWGNHNAGMQNLYDDCRRDLGLLADDVDIYPLNYPQTNFYFMGNRMEISIDGTSLILDHYPIASWNHIGKGSFMIHGHCHRNLKEDSSLKRLDISWDWKKRPVEWKEIQAELGGRVFKAIDHHGNDEVNSQFFEKP